MIKFGPAGNPDAFYEAGYRHTWQMMGYLKDMGLEAYEYSCGRGVRLGAETASRIREEALEKDITVSIHAPYFINLANPDPEKFENNITYFTEVSEAARVLGAKRVVFHPGSPMKDDRRQAFERCLCNFRRVLDIMDEKGFSDITYCPETMGKLNQLGDLDEIIELANVDERVIPTIDFAHLHARGQGALVGEQAFSRIIDALESGIGTERTRKIHIHFSTIEYTKMGEKRHRTFDEKAYGPRFEDLAPVLIRKRMEPVVICECAGTMAKDALEMKTIYESLIEKEVER